jgi:hypothetical protein
MKNMETESSNAEQAECRTQSGWAESNSKYSGVK